jgi:hypothetical protein
MKRLYHCDYCDDAASTRKAMRKHEADCDSNPATRCCWTCNFHMTFPYNSYMIRRVWDRCHIMGRVKYTRQCDKWEPSNGKTKWVESARNDFRPANVTDEGRGIPRPSPSDCSAGGDA